MMRLLSRKPLQPETPPRSRRSACRRRLLCLIGLGALLTSVARGADGGLSWKGADVTGKEIAVPAADRVSVIAFVRRDQAQSTSALKEIAALAGGQKLQVIVILSGTQAGDARQPVEGADAAWPVISDPDFKAAGELNVHVWPTTVVVSGDGQRVGRLAGFSPTFPADLQSQSAFADGSIDEAALQQRLAHHEVVEQSASQMASHRLQLAERLITAGQLDEAEAQLREAMQLHPQDASLQLAMARVLILGEKPQDALSVLAGIKPESAPKWQLATLRGKALVKQEKWPEAKEALAGSTELNPQPAEAYYLLGLVYQHDNDSARAADSFRKAYESAVTGVKE